MFSLHVFFPSMLQLNVSLMFCQRSSRIFYSQEFQVLQESQDDPFLLCCHLNQEVLSSKTQKVHILNSFNPHLVLLKNLKLCFGLLAVDEHKDLHSVNEIQPKHDQIKPKYLQLYTICEVLNSQD